MTFDTIAFTQDELDNALNLCCTSIGLCDNDFILPQIAGVTYISIRKSKIQKRRYEKAQHKLYRICTAICTTDMRTFYFGFFLYNIISI